MPISTSLDEPVSHSQLVLVRSGAFLARNPKWLHTLLQLQSSEQGNCAGGHMTRTRDLQLSLTPHHATENTEFFAHGTRTTRPVARMGGTRNPV
jgi:hypothetical protein